MLDSEPAQLSACSVLTDGSIYKQHMSGDVLTGRWASSHIRPLFQPVMSHSDDLPDSCCRRSEQNAPCTNTTGGENVCLRGERKMGGVGGLGLALKAAINSILMGHHKQQPALSSLLCLMPNCAE